MAWALLKLGFFASLFSLFFLHFFSFFSPFRLCRHLAIGIPAFSKIPHLSPLHADTNPLIHQRRGQSKAYVYTLGHGLCLYFRTELEHAEISTAFLSPCLPRGPVLVPRLFRISSHVLLFFPRKVQSFFFFSWLTKHSFCEMSHSPPLEFWQCFFFFSSLIDQSISCFMRYGLIHLERLHR